MYLTWRVSALMAGLLAFGGCQPALDGDQDQDQAQVEAEKLKKAFEQILPGASRFTERVREQTQWTKKNDLTAEQYARLRDQWADRTNYHGADRFADFWAIAKSSTAGELEKRYPPLLDHEWFTARVFTDSRSQWRRLKRSSFTDLDAPYELSITIILRVWPDRPTSRLEGQLKLLSHDGLILREEDIDHEPDISFEDSTFYYVTFEYDDEDDRHRKLRFDDELSVEFTLRRVTLADGTVRVFNAK